MLAHMEGVILIFSLICRVLRMFTGHTRDESSWLPSVLMMFTADSLCWSFGRKVILRRHSTVLWPHILCLAFLRFERTETLLHTGVRGDRNITVFLQSSSMEPWHPRFFAKPGRTSGSGTATATRQDCRCRGKTDHQKDWECICWMCTGCFFSRTCRLSPCTNTWATGSLRTYTFSIFSGAMYSPWASLKMFFLRSIIFRTPLYSQNSQVRRDNWGLFCSTKHNLPSSTNSASAWQEFMVVLIQSDECGTNFLSSLHVCRVQMNFFSVIWVLVLTGSHFPMSPVWSQPSLSRASAVFSGSFKYPLNTFLPLMQTWKTPPKHKMQYFSSFLMFDCGFALCTLYQCTKILKQSLKKNS